MQQDKPHALHIPNERGILKKSGGAFHNPMDFAVQNLYYAAWSNRYVCSSQYKVKRESLDFYSVIYVLDGEMDLTYEDKLITVHKDEAVLLDFRMPHAYQTRGRILDKWEIVFKGSASEAYYSLITQQWGNLFRVSGGLKQTLLRLMSELESPFPKDHTVSLLIQEMFCRIIDQQSVRLSEPVEKAIAYMYSHYSEPLKIGDIADAVPLTRHYFSRRFLKETGRTPSEYLAEIRISAAKELLSENRMPIAEIADKCGFINVSHFSRFFKEKTGETPAAFRHSLGSHN